MPSLRITDGLLLNEDQRGALQGSGSQVGHLDTWEKVHRQRGRVRNSWCPGPEWGELGPLSLWTEALR